MSIRRHPIAAGQTTASLSRVPLDADLVRRLRAVFERVQRHELHLGEVFYSRLFTAAPHLRPLFRGPTSQQAEKLIATLKTVVENLEHPDENAALLADLGRLHASLGVKPEHYELVIDVMIASMEQLLGPHADRRDLEDWQRTLQLISHRMITAGVKSQG